MIKRRPHKITKNLPLTLPCPHCLNPLPCPCGHTVIFEKSEDFVKKIGRPHLKTSKNFVQKMTALDKLSLPWLRTYFSEWPQKQRCNAMKIKLNRIGVYSIVDEIFPRNDVFYELRPKCNDAILWRSSEPIRWLTNYRTYLQGALR